MDLTYNLNGGFKPTNKRNADLDGPDFFPTPKWATHALLQHEEFQGPIWECACGNGAMSEVLKVKGYEVVSSDLFDRGYGQSNVDFTKSEKHFDNIVTNPPYNSAEQFIHTGHRLYRKKFALLLRLAFLEGVNRQNTIFSVKPPARIWVFSERITFYAANAERQGSGTTAYAWFVWEKNVDQTVVNWITPGLKAKFID